MQLSRRLLVAAGLSAPFAAHAAENPGENAPPPQNPIAGVLLPAGANGLIGDECFRGIQMAAADINQAGGIAGRPLTLLPAGAFGQSDAGQAAKTLIDGHAGFLLGSGTSTLSYPGSAAAELAQIPYIELNAIADGITGRGFKFLLRTCHTSTMVAGVAVNAITAQPGAPKKLALLFNTGATSGAVAAAALKALAAAGRPPLLTIGYPEDTADLHEPVQRMSRAGADTLLHAGSADDVLLLFQAMQETGWRPAAIYGCDEGYLLRETAYALGAAFDGVYAIGAPLYPPRAAYLSDAYEARFGMPPRAAASLTAYVGAKLVFDSLNLQNGDVTKLLDAMRRTDLPTGTLANGFGVAFDKNGQNTRSFAILQQWRGQALTAV